jgi:glycerophosphoryl diester phosphodiesterase
VVARFLTVAAAVLAAVASATPAVAAPAIHAHRGGSVLAGVPTYAENTLPAFRHAAREGYVLELDAKLTEDRVPVVFHDATLDRVTPCSGGIAERTLAQLKACPVDLLGSPGSGLPTRRAAQPVQIPTLASVLALATAEGARLNLELKNLPTDSDFDPGSGFANRVMDTVIGSGLSRSQLIVQSFWPPNLGVARSRLPGVETSLLTLSATNAGAAAYAALAGYDWASPAWPVSAAFVSQAHALGRRVVPYTLDTPADVRAAAAAGVDALITNDPAMAVTTLGLSRQQLVPDRLPPHVRLSAPRYASDRSRRSRFAVRWRGTDRGSGIARYRLEARRNANVATRWRTIAHTNRTRAAFRGRAGATYLFRLRAGDRFGNLSAYGYGVTVVPRDDRAGSLRLSRGWLRVPSRGAYRRTLTRAPVAGARARLRFRGSRVALIARRSPRGGRLLVRLDGRRRVISLRGRPRQRLVVFRSPRLRPTRHVLALASLGGGVVDLDGVGVTTGPRVAAAPTS